MEVVAELTDEDRRVRIADTALDLAAAGGNRAVTHSAVDRALELPKGSTSYYFRTRRALLDAALTRLTAVSAEAFAHAMGNDPAETVARYLRDLGTVRSRDVRARLALATDAAHDPALAAALRESLFSTSSAEHLFKSLASDDPTADAADLVAFCEGVAARTAFGASCPEVADLAAAVRRRFDAIATYHMSQ